MARTSTNVNATVPEQARGNTAQAEYSPNDLEERRQLVREGMYTNTEVMAEGMTTQQLDANRDVPRTIRPSGEGAERLKRPLPSANTKRAMLSSRRKKDLSAAKQDWQKQAPKTRLKAVRAVVGSPDMLEDVNNEVRGTLGRRSDMNPKVERLVHRMDLAIQDFERHNQREHLVYSTLRAPSDTEQGRKGFRNAMRRMAESGESFTFDGYIPATHSMGNLGDGEDVVMEIQTYSGAYLGSSDSKPDADHIIGRGRRMQVVGVREAEFAKPDGATGKRWVVQMRDVSDQDGN